MRNHGPKCFLQGLWRSDVFFQVSLRNDAHSACNQTKYGCGVAALTETCMQICANEVLVSKNERACWTHTSRWDRFCSSRSLHADHVRCPGGLLDATIPLQKNYIVPSRCRKNRHNNLNLYIIYRSVVVTFFFRWVTAVSDSSSIKIWTTYCWHKNRTEWICWRRWFFPLHHAHSKAIHARHTTFPSAFIYFVLLTILQTLSCLFGSSVLDKLDTPFMDSGIPGPRMTLCMDG